MDTDWEAPELNDLFEGEVSRGEFGTIADARASFFVKLDRSVADVKAGRTTDAEIVFARLRERYANWPRAAE